MGYELDNSSACQYIFKIYSLCHNIILEATNIDKLSATISKSEVYIECKLSQII